LRSPDDEKVVKALKEELMAGTSIADVIAKFGIQTFTDLDFVGDKPVIPFTNLAGALLPGRPAAFKFKGYDKSKALVKNGVYEGREVFQDGKHWVEVGGKLWKRSEFTNPQSSTGHSCQGETIDRPFVILEAGHFYATPEWFYTALTRCVRLSDVWVYVGVSTSQDVKRKISWKIEGHRKADLEAGRSWEEEDYITSRWVCETLKKQNYCCSLCFVPLSLVYAEGDPAQFSVNRHCNALAHIKSNCSMTCLSCNQGYRPTSSSSIPKAHY
jgi:hypothetical protein